MPISTKTAVIATALIAGTVSASPLLKARQDYNQYGCYQKLQTPLGWNVPGDQLYADTLPSLWANAHGQVNYTTFTAGLVPSKTPSNFTFWSCDDAIHAENKGDTEVYIGYAVEDTTQLCLAVDQLEQNPYKGAHVQLARCNPGDPHQNWQFSSRSFYDYHRLDFLGNTQGPYPPGYIARPGSFPFFQSSPGYHLHNTSNSFNVHYDPSKYHGDNATTFVYNPAWNSVKA